MITIFNHSYVIPLVVAFFHPFWVPKPCPALPSPGLSFHCARFIQPVDCHCRGHAGNICCTIKAG